MKKRKRRCKKTSSRGRMREITFGEVSGRSGRFRPVYVGLDKLFILSFRITKGPRATTNCPHTTKEMLIQPRGMKIFLCPEKHLGQRKKMNYLCVLCGEIIAV